MAKFLKYFFNGLINICKWFYYRLLGIFKLLFTTKYYCQPSYFPEYSSRRKSSIQIFFEQLWNVLKYGYVNDFYFTYGFDIKRFRDKSQYVDYSEFRTRRNFYLALSPDVPASVLRNKWVFGLYAKQINLRTPSLYALIEKGSVHEPTKNEKISLDAFFKKYNNIDCYCKAIGGECGMSVFHILVEDGVIKLNDETVNVVELQRLLGAGLYLLQETVKNQIKEISDIYSLSINTIRLETIRNPHTGEIEILPPLLRVGANGNTIDNWAKGGLVIEIDSDKCTLGKYGWYKASYGTKTKSHPDTGVVFEGHYVPFLHEAIEDAKKFHRCLPGLHSIGWDIAITEDGPVFIEGNDNWELSLVQTCSHGLYSDFKRLFY